MLNVFIRLLGSAAFAVGLSAQGASSAIHLTTASEHLAVVSTSGQQWMGNWFIYGSSGAILNIDSMPPASGIDARIGTYKTSAATHILYGHLADGGARLVAEYTTPSPNGAMMLTYHWELRIPVQDPDMASGLETCAQTEFQNGLLLHRGVLSNPAILDSPYRADGGDSPKNWLGTYTFVMNGAKTQIHITNVSPTEDGVEGQYTDGISWYPFKAYFVQLSYFVDTTNVTCVLKGIFGSTQHRWSLTGKLERHFAGEANCTVPVPGHMGLTHQSITVPVYAYVQ